MKNPPTRPSLRSSRNWPPLALELRGAPRLGWAWGSWCIGLAAALWWGCDLAWWWRLALLVIVALAFWRGLREFSGLGGNLRCESGQRWRHESPDGDNAYVEPAAPRLLGPLLWLSWPSRRGRRFVTLDAMRVEPNAWRAIKARMKFPGPAGRDKSP
ncbi:MAG: hypothetical protein ACRES2_03235 [Steroidobacteraceae bacterium]